MGLALNTSEGIETVTLSGSMVTAQAVVGTQARCFAFSEKQIILRHIKTKL